MSCSAAPGLGVPPRGPGAGGPEKKKVLSLIRKQPQPTAAVQQYQHPSRSTAPLSHGLLVYLYSVSDINQHKPKETFNIFLLYFFFSAALGHIQRSHAWRGGYPTRPGAQRSHAWSGLPVRITAGFPAATTGCAPGPLARITAMRTKAPAHVAGVPHRESPPKTMQPETCNQISGQKHATG